MTTQTTQLSKTHIASHIQDAYHYALRATGNDWSQFTDQEGTRDWWMCKAINEAVAAGMLFEGFSTITRRTLPSTLAIWAATQGVNAYRGTVIATERPTGEQVSAILKDTLGLNNAERGI